jgi:hypothetical protein
MHTLRGHKSRQTFIAQRRRDIDCVAAISREALEKAKLQKCIDFYSLAPRGRLQVDPKSITACSPSSAGFRKYCKAGLAGITGKFAILRVEGAFSVPLAVGLHLPSAKSTDVVLLR